MRILRWGNQDADDAALWQAADAGTGQRFWSKRCRRDWIRCWCRGARIVPAASGSVCALPAHSWAGRIWLVLDDSTSALDYQTDARLRQSLKKIEGSPAVLIVSQRIASIRHADFILVMDQGRLVGQGTHEELLDSCAVYQEIVPFTDEGGSTMSQSALLRRLLSYVKPYGLLLGMALVFALLQVAMTLSAPVIIGQAVDAIVAAGQVDFIRVTQTLAALAAVVILAALFQLLMTCCTNACCYRTIRDLRMAMLRAVSRAASSNAGQNAAGRFYEYAGQRYRRDL